MYTMIHRPVNTMNAFAQLFSDRAVRDFFEAGIAPEMHVDVRENEKAYLMEADLPGTKKEDIHLNVDKDVLTISANLNNHKKESREGWVCSERRWGHVERSFGIEGIDASAISADYVDGVLRIILPKVKPEEEKNRFEIAIGEGTKAAEPVQEV